MGKPFWAMQLETCFYYRWQIYFVHMEIACIFWFPPIESGCWSSITDVQSCVRECVNTCLAPPAIFSTALLKEKKKKQMKILPWWRAQSPQRSNQYHHDVDSLDQTRISNEKSRAMGQFLLVLAWIDSTQQQRRQKSIITTCCLRIGSEYNNEP